MRSKTPAATRARTVSELSTKRTCKHTHGYLPPVSKPKQTVCQHPPGICMGVSNMYLLGDDKKSVNAKRRACLQVIPPPVNLWKAVLARFLITVIAITAPPCLLSTLAALGCAAHPKCTHTCRAPFPARRRRHRQRTHDTQLPKLTLCTYTFTQEWSVKQLSISLPTPTRWEFK